MSAPVGALTRADDLGPAVPVAPGARQVAVTILRLKLRLLTNVWRTDTWSLVGAVIGYLFGAGLAFGLVATAVGMRLADPDLAQDVVIAVGFFGTLLWALVPLVTFALDETVDPARFSLLPLGPGTLLPGVLLAGAVGAPGLATLLGGLATTVTWARGPEIVVAPVMALIGTATCICISRVVTTAASGLLSARRGREAAAAAVALVGVVAALVPPAVTALVSRAEGEDGFDLDRVAQVLGWTPLAAAWAVPGDVARGYEGRAAARALISVVVLAALLLGWRRLLGRSLETPVGSASRTTKVTRRSLFDRLPPTPVGAVTARMLLTFRRDSRYLVALASPLFLTVIMGVTSHGQFAGAGFGTVLGAFAVGLTACNTFGYDGSAFAAHLYTSVSGRADRWGRAIALIVVSLPVILLASALGAALSGTGRHIPLLLSLGLGVLLVTVGAGSVVAVLAPYPMPAAGSNPFVSRSFGGVRPFLAQFALMGLLGVAIVPALILGLLVDATWAHALALVVTPLLGSVALVAGVEASATLYTRRGPEILAAVRRDG